MNRTEEDDYRAFVAARLERLRRMAYLLCRDWHTADDLVAVTLAKLYRRWRHIDREAGADAYTRTVLMRAWLDETRRPWRRETAADDLTDSASPADPLTGVADRSELIELLARLGERQRAVVVLRFYCDLSVEETAAILGITAGTVKSQAARALETLRSRTADGTGG